MKARVAKWAIAIIARSKIGKKGALLVIIAELEDQI